MTVNALERLEVDEKTAKRAQYEAFEFELEAPGIIKVVNGSHPEDELDDHTYRVDIEDGVPTACECKAFEYHPGDCKHMVAVAIREPVLAAATDAPTPADEDGDKRAIADGGQVMADEAPPADETAAGLVEKIGFIVGIDAEDHAHLHYPAAGMVKVYPVAEGFDYETDELPDEPSHVEDLEGRPLSHWMEFVRERRGWALTTHRAPAGDWAADGGADR